MSRSVITRDLDLTEVEVANGITEGLVIQVGRTTFVVFETADSLEVSGSTVSPVGRRNDLISITKARTNALQRLMTLRAYRSTRPEFEGAA